MLAVTTVSVVVTAGASSSTADGGDADPQAAVVSAIKAAVAARQPVDERERGAISTILAELERLPRPLDRDADPTHVTAAAIVVGQRGVVLHRHKRLGLWLQPGGHLDPGELPADAALREAVEETGLAVHHRAVPPQLVHVDVHPGPHEHTHLDLRYLLEAGDNDPAPPESESQDVRWFGWDEAIAIADEGLAGALRALRPPSLESAP